MQSEPVRKFLPEDFEVNHGIFVQSYSFFSFYKFFFFWNM